MDPYRGSLQPDEEARLDMLKKYPTTPRIEVSSVVISPSTQGRGGKIDFSFSITSSAEETQKLIVDFVVYYHKANGKLAPKVFRLRDLSLPAKKQSLLRSRLP